MPRSRKTREAPDIFKKYRNSGWEWEENVDRKSLKDPLVYFIVYKFKCPNCNHPKYSEWESPLIGAANGELCENPKCKGNPPVLPNQKVRSPTSCTFTDQKFYGEFQCDNCLRNWSSGHAWGGTYQVCEACNDCETMVYVYPYNLAEHGFSHGGNREKHHQRHLCGKCLLGLDCSKLAKKDKGQKPRSKATAGPGSRRGRKRKSGNKGSVGPGNQHKNQVDGLKAQIQQISAQLGRKLKI